MADTSVHFAYVKPTATGDVPVVNARLRFALVNKEILVDKIRVPETFDVTLPTGSGTVLLSETDPGEAWQVQELSPISGRQTVLVLVPHSTTPIEFTSLTRVSKSSLAVENTGPVWVGQLEALDARVDDLESAVAPDQQVLDVAGKVGHVSLVAEDIVGLSSTLLDFDDRVTDLEHPSPGSGSAFVHNQPTPLATWTITTPVGFGSRKPTVDIYTTDGEAVDADVVVNPTTVTITFGAPFAGSAILT